MTASRQEVAEVVQQFLADVIGHRMTRSGQVVLHFSEGGVFQRAEVNQIYKPPPDEDLPCRRPRILTRG